MQRQRQKQIPFGNDKQKGKGNDKYRLPAGMTNEKKQEQRH
jgi:hypothetical protein